MKFKLLFVFSCLIQFGCVGPAPVWEYNQAHQALQMAAKSGAKKYANGILDQAEEAYRAGELKYKNRENEKARQLFSQSIQLSEKAEMRARTKKFDLGESF